MDTATAYYRMNPAEDKILTAAELTVGMLALYEIPALRTPRGSDEDERIRAQCFRRIVRFLPADEPTIMRFVGEWIDGYQEVHVCQRTSAWLVKKAAAELAEGDAGLPGGAA